MNIIKEYLLDKKCSAPQALYLPENANVFGARESDIGLVLVTVSNPTETATSLRTFKVCSVDENIYAKNIKYVDSYQDITGVHHIFEILD